MTRYPRNGRRHSTSPEKAPAPRRRRSALKTAWTAIQILFLLLVAAIVIAMAGTLYTLTRSMPSMREIGLASGSTIINSADGVRLARVYRENRDYIPLDQIPDHLQQATVAIEDDRFYTHPGIDPKGIVRALVSNVRGGNLGQGGSTITQQLARNAFGLGRQKTLTRKLQELVVAMRLERRYTKSEILEGYLNQVYFGSRAYGVQAAALEYFGKPAKNVTLAEAALIAGLPQRPTVYNPYRSPDAARNRRDVVLNRMAELTYITAAEAEAAKREPVRLSRKTETMGKGWKAPYFVDYVLKELTRRYGDEMVFQGGLTVSTTLLYPMQQAAEAAAKAGQARAVRAGYVRPTTQVALTCVDPHNGYVRAVVGGMNWEKSQFNRAISNTRQPGSTFKLFVYTAALNEGWTPYSRVADSPKTWRIGGGKRWSPKNYDGVWRGRVSLINAVAWSVNMAAIRTAEAVGMPKVVALARRLGLKGQLPLNYSTAIGAGGASTLEMAAAYGAFAVKGKYVQPTPITMVKDMAGNVLEEQEPYAVQVVDSEVAEKMNTMLRAVVTVGTGREAGSVPDAHGKTGTTNDDRDAWFVGFNQQLSTAVWIGNDDYSPMRHAYGGKACAPIWADFMNKALAVNPRNRPDYTDTLRFGAPDKAAGPATVTDASGNLRIRICNSSEDIATNRCPGWRTRSFKPGEEPTTVCTRHPGEALSPAPTQGTGAPDENRRRRPTEEEPIVIPRERADSTPAGRADERAPERPAEGGNVTVTLCAETGLLAGPGCTRTATRSLPAATAPRTTCEAHR